MRSHGLIYRADGTLKAAWSWQDRTRPCSFHLPIEDGDEVIVLDPEHPDIPDELDVEMVRARQAAMRPEWARARTTLRVSVRRDPNREAVLHPGLFFRVLSKERTQDHEFQEDVAARLIREHRSL